MTAADLLADLQARGIILEVHGDRLRYRPADRVTEADLAALRHLKAGVIELLTGPGNHGSDPPAPTVACLACNTLASMLFWRERLPPAGWLGIALAAVAVVLLNQK